MSPSDSQVGRVARQDTLQRLLRNGFRSRCLLEGYRNDGVRLPDPPLCTERPRVLVPGEALDTALTTRIAMATTFLSLYSQTYADSPYCSGELALAVNLKRSGKKPDRIVGLRLDDSTLSPALAGSVWLEASDRLSIDAAVHRILAAEAEAVS